MGRQGAGGAHLDTVFSGRHPKAVEGRPEGIEGRGEGAEVGRHGGEGWRPQMVQEWLRQGTPRGQLWQEVEEGRNPWLCLHLKGELCREEDARLHQGRAVCSHHLAGRWGRLHSPRGN